MADKPFNGEHVFEVLGLPVVVIGDMKVLPLSVIQAAVEGDREALASVVKHYQGYIRYLAIRPLRDEYGNEYLCVDEDMRLRLEAKLIHSIVTDFKILPA